MNESAKPGIVIVSSSNTKPKSLIKLITRLPVTDDPTDPNIVSQEWLIETKYYTATVNLMGITEDYVRTDEFNRSIEALIIHMDSNKDTGLDDLQKWAGLEADCDAEIKLLISNYFTPNTKISKTDATKWCLKRGFELIELYPTVTVDSQSDDVIEEKIGVDRVIEALQAHVWSNLQMKKPSQSGSAGDFDKTFDSFLTSEGVDDFSELFTQLNMFKESISSMSNGQRKQNAEQLVSKFWQAIGGDEEELADV